MQVFLRLILPVLLLCGVVARMPGNPEASEYAPFKQTEADTLQMRDFNHQQYEAWDSGTKSWYQEQYFKGCLKRLGFKLNCTDCTNLGVELELEVDEFGKIAAWKEVKSKIYCHHHSEASELRVKDCIIDSFVKLILPDGFRSKILIVYIGRVPSC